MDAKRSDSSGRKKVLILGGGFGGVYVFFGLRKLAKRGKIELTLVSMEDHFLFTPLLHEVVSGRVRSSSVRILLSELVRGRNIRFARSCARGVDVLKKKVDTSEGEIPYDILVVALGARVHFFSVEGAENLPVLKELSDGERLKELVSAIQKKEGKQRIVIVGGGATGVELASEIADALRLSANKEKFEVAILESRDDILMASHETLRKAARRSLEKRGVSLTQNCFVTKVGAGAIETKDGRTIPFDLAVWTAGVKPVDIAFSPAQSRSPAGRLKVLGTLQLEAEESIFAVGDVADGYPMTAQVAQAEAKTAAQNITALLSGKPLETFAYKDQGMLFSLGRWMAGAELKLHLINKVIYFWGFPAWVFWHFAYLAKIPTWRQKLRVARDFFALARKRN